MRKNSESEWLAKDNMETDPITIKPETASHEAELFSWVPLPSCSPPRCPFPIKSLALSAHVSPQTIHFWVLGKSPVSGPGRGHPSFSKWWLWRELFFIAIAIMTTRGTQGPACLPMDQTQWWPQLGPFCPCLLLMWTTGQSALTGKEQETLLTSLLFPLFPLLNPSYTSLFFSGPGHRNLVKAPQHELSIGDWSPPLGRELKLWFWSGLISGRAEFQSSLLWRPRIKSRNDWISAGGKRHL